MSGLLLLYPFEGRLIQPDKFPDYVKHDYDICGRVYMCSDRASRHKSHISLFFEFLINWKTQCREIGWCNWGIYIITEQRWSSHLWNWSKALSCIVSCCLWILGVWTSSTLTVSSLTRSAFCCFISTHLLTHPIAARIIASILID